MADLGCGDARLASALRERGSSHRVLSFDLVSRHAAVVAAQCTDHVPLPGGEAAVVDAVVICLALMGSDWLGMVKEARRVMRPRCAVHVVPRPDPYSGQLFIAEVTSRIPDQKALVRAIEQVGFKLDKEVRSSLQASLMPQDSSNSHFVLLRFNGAAPGKVKPADEARAAALLTPCIYKKR